ncbi:DUF5979 domain-containing protein, partial [Sediminihabitans luteus]
MSNAPRHARPPLQRFTAASAALSLALVGSLAVVATVSTSETAAAAPADLIPPASGILPGPAPEDSTGAPGAWGPCVPDDESDDNCSGWLIPPNILGQFYGTDNGPNVIVGGDFSVPSDGGTETEGLMVINGSATFDRGYSVGVVGAGTGVVPADDEDMFVTGGDTTVNGTSTGVTAYGADGSGGYRTATLRVGGAHNFTDPSYTANGTYGDLGDVDSANQDTLLGPTQNYLYTDVSVIDDDHYTDLFGPDGKMSRYSQQCYAELSTTDATTVVNEGGALTLEQGTLSNVGNVYTATSDGTGDLVVFTIPDMLGSATQSVTVSVVGVKPGATVLVNTLGTGTVQQRISDIIVGDGDPNSTLEAGDRVLWNYPFATDVTLGGDTQLPGSILIGNPASTASIGFSGTNGRIYAAGDLVHTGSVFNLTGLEYHSFPFTGALGCVQTLPGTFSVAKSVEGDGVGEVPDDTTFTVDWEVTAPSDSPNLGRTGTLDVLADGTPVTGPIDLAEGDEVTLSEPTFPEIEGVDWGTPVISPNSVVIGAEGTVAEVEVTNTATLERGGFTITKAVTGDDGASTTDFTGTWTCDAENLDGQSTGSWSLSDGEDVTVTGFPTGTTCSVTEDAPTDDNGDWESTIDPDGDFVIVEGDGTETTVTVTNEFTHAVGGFTITKAVEGDDGASTTEFTGTWTCDAENADGLSSGTWTLADGEDLALDGFPTGTTCSVTEDAPTDDNGDWSPTISPEGDFVIVEGDATAIAVTVTNEFTHAIGGFTITKEVTGDDGASTTEFSGTWTCDAPNAAGDTTGTWSLADGGSSAVAGFPTGTTCSVTEDAPTDDNGTWESSIDPEGDFVIVEGDGTETTVTVTNEFTHAVGGFTITKAVAGDEGATTTEFTGTWTCDAANTDGDTTGTWTLTDGDELALDGFPTGTTCSVTEDVPTEEDGSWVSSIDPEGDFVIVEGDATATTVTVTNTYSQTPVGGFTITKAVTGDDGASTTEFTGTWTCDAEDADGETTGTWTLVDGGEVTVAGFPVGTACSVAEDAPTDDNGTWESTIDPDGEFTIVEGDGTETTVTVTNDFTRAVGGFTITKAVTGDDGASTTEFTGTWTCDAANADGDTTGTWTLADGDELALAGFPT